MTGEGSKATIDEELLVSLARELTDTVAEFRSVRNNSSVTINAGGLTSAIAVCMAGSAIVLFILLAIWLMWQIGEIKGQQEAWIQVWQQKTAQPRN